VFVDRTHAGIVLISPYLDWQFIGGNHTPLIPNRVLQGLGLHHRVRHGLALAANSLVAKLTLASPSANSFVMFVLLNCSTALRNLWIGRHGLRAHQQFPELC
jgi:hypothetical protein